MCGRLISRVSEASPAAVLSPFCDLPLHWLEALPTPARPRCSFPCTGTTSLDPWLWPDTRTLTLGEGGRGERKLGLRQYPEAAGPSVGGEAP